MVFVRTTKERQWKHPGLPPSEGTAKPKGKAAHSETDASDETSGSNSSRRNSKPKSSTTGRVTTGSISEEVQPVERLSKRLRLSDKKLLEAMIAENDATSATTQSQDGTSSTTNPAARKKSSPPKPKPVAGPSAGAESSNTPANSRADRIKALKEANIPEVDDNNNSVGFGDLSITQMEYLGIETKSGFLMKQSSILGL